MNKKFFAGLLSISLMISSVPVAAAADASPIDASVISLIGNWVISQIYATWNQVYNEHPRLAVSLLMLSAGAFVYQSNSPAAAKARRALDVARDVIRRKVFGCEGKREKAKPAKQKRENKKTAAAPVTQQ